jgi:uncharacterized membrane protein required for colicin V production
MATTYRVLGWVCAAVVAHELLIVLIAFLLVLVPYLLFLEICETLLFVKALAELL